MSAEQNGRVVVTRPFGLFTVELDAFVRTPRAGPAVSHVAQKKMHSDADCA